MVTAHVLSVLAAIGTSAPERARDARVAAYRKVPVALRGVVRTRVTRVVSDAIFATPHGDDEAHVHRLAYLTVLRIEPEGPGDRDAVRAAFEQARAQHGARERPSVIRSLAIGALLLVLPGLTLGYWLWPRDPYATLHASLPPSAAAYREGGRPASGTDAQRALFRDRFPEFVIALNRWSAGLANGETAAGEAVDRAAVDREAAATVAEARVALGPEIGSYLQAVIDQSIAIVETEGSLGHLASAHVASVDALDASLAEAGLGFYVDAEISSDTGGRHRVYLSTFTVENVALYQSGDHVVRALRLRRLDTLTFARAVLGFTRPEVRDALVLMDPLEDHLVTSIVPALAEGGAMPIADARDVIGRELVDTLGREAGEAVREEARGWMGGDASPAAELGAVLARRRAFFEAWGERLARDGIVLRAPDTYVLDPERYAQLARTLTPPERRDLDALAEELGEERHMITYRAIEGRFVASIERHEVQHRLDFLMGTLSVVPPALEALTGPVREGDWVNALARRANAEHSAYLTELARDPSIVRANLALLTRNLFDERLWGSAECYAALVIVEGLAARTGITHAPLIVSRTIDRAEVGRVFLALIELVDAALRGHAQALWESSYARSLPPLRSSARSDRVWGDDP